MRYVLRLDLTGLSHASVCIDTNDTRLLHSYPVLWRGWDFIIIVSRILSASSCSDISTFNILT